MSVISESFFALYALDKRYETKVHPGSVTLVQELVNLDTSLAITISSTLTVSDSTSLTPMGQINLLVNH